MRSRWAQDTLNNIVKPPLRAFVLSLSQAFFSMYPFADWNAAVSQNVLPSVSFCQNDYRVSLTRQSGSFLKRVLHHMLFKSSHHYSLVLTLSQHQLTYLSQIKVMNVGEEDSRALNETPLCPIVGKVCKRNNMEGRWHQPLLYGWEPAQWLSWGCREVVHNVFLFFLKQGNQVTLPSLYLLECEALTYLTYSWMGIRVLEYKKNPEYKPNATNATKYIENWLPAKMFSHDTTNGVAQNKSKVLSWIIWVQELIILIQCTINKPVYKVDQSIPTIIICMNLFLSNSGNHFCIIE